MRQKTIIPLVLALTAGMLGACGKTGPVAGDNGEAAGKPAVKAKKADEPAEIVFFSNNGNTEEVFNRNWGDAIRKKFPHYTIKYIQRVMGSTEIQNLVASGTKFDIYYDSLGYYESRLTDNNLQVDMTDLFKTHQVDLNRFEPTVIDAMKRMNDGKMLALPVFTSSIVLYYNRDIFDKFGVAYPKDGMTWDQLAETAKKLTRNEGGKQYYGFSSYVNVLIQQNQLSLPYIEVKTDKPTIAANDKWKSFMQTALIEPVNVESYKTNIYQALKDPDAFVKDQSIAMYATFAGLPNQATEALKTFNWDMVSLPTFKELPGVGPQLNPSYFGITKFTRNVDAAMEVLKFLTSDEFQTQQARQGYMPAVSSDAIRKQLGKDHVFKDKNFGAIYVNKFAQIPTQPFYDVQLSTIYRNAAVDIMRGALDLNSGFRRAEEEGIKKIEEYKSGIKK